MGDMSFPGRKYYTGEVLGEDLAGSFGMENPFLWQTKPWDEEVTLYYSRARYYEGKTGRFLGVDGFVKGKGTCISMNISIHRYVYADNYPLGSDATGNLSPAAACGLCVGAYLGSSALGCFWGAVEGRDRRCHKYVDWDIFKDCMDTIMGNTDYWQTLALSCGLACLGALKSPLPPTTAPKPPIIIPGGPTGFPVRPPGWMPIPG